MNRPKDTPSTRTPGSGAASLTPQKTPEAKDRSSETPPSGPSLLQKRLNSDIEAALAKESADFLCLALMRSHSCGEDHSIYEATRRQHCGALAFLLNNKVQDPNVPCGNHCALHLAIQVCMTKGDAGYRMAEMLLANGADPNLGAPGGGRMTDLPLHLAVKRGVEDAVELLLKYGADPNLANASGSTPLHVICRQAPIAGHSGDNLLSPYGTLALLLKHNADPTLTDLFGLEPVKYTRDSRVQEVLQQAHRQWTRCTLLRARGKSGAPRAAGTCWLLPEIFERIITFA